MTLRAVAIEAMSALGIKHDEPKRVRRTIEQTGAALLRQGVNGTVVKRAEEGLALVWRVAL